MAHYLLSKASLRKREAFKNDDFLGLLTVEGGGGAGLHRLLALPTRLMIVYNNNYTVNFQSIYPEFSLVYSRHKLCFYQ